MLERAISHLFGILLEAAFPILSCLTLSLLQVINDAADFTGPGHPAQAHIDHAADRNNHPHATRRKPKKIKHFGLPRQVAGGDLLDDTHPLVRIDNLIAYLKRHDFPRL